MQLDTQDIEALLGALKVARSKSFADHPLYRRWVDLTHRLREAKVILSGYKGETE